MVQTQAIVEATEGTFAIEVPSKVRARVRERLTSQSALFISYVLPLTAQLSYSAIRASLDTETDVFTWDHVESSEVLKQRFQQLSLTIFSVSL